VQPVGFKSYVCGKIFDTDKWLERRAYIWCRFVVT